MLNCRACLWRCIQAISAHSYVINSQHLHRSAASSTCFAQQRLYLRTSARTVRKVTARPAFLAEVEKASQYRGDPWKQSTQAAGLKKRDRKGLTRQRDALKVAKAVAIPAQRRLGRRDPRIPLKDWHNRKNELQYLADPLELATFVKKELVKGKTTEMLQLVRMASNSMQCVVSWNHIIDHYLAKGQIAQAIKVYNDMKKRAQFPDAYTYTILLRGLSLNAHMTGALGRALSIYHSLFAPNSRMQPSIIHTNAMLKVCARVEDMDALWGVAAKIPETGPASANAVTFVTILNAIRQSLLVRIPVGQSEEDIAKRIEKGIVEGRRIWEDVIGKWRNADLVMEEELVCAMGRLLLIGSRPRDWDDVLSMVEQTMDIPRLVPRLGTTARKDAGYPRLRSPNVSEQFRFDDDHLSPSQGPARGDEFLPITTHGIGNAVSSALAYATPSNNTLSLVQEACQKVVANKAAGEYWSLLTDPTTYGIVPDVNNFHQRLRVFRQNRASADALELLRDGFIGNNLQPRPATFRIAMSTCVRDKNNHNSLKHAGQILDIMTTSLEDADPKTVNMYADLAISFPLAKGQDYIDALARLDLIVRNIRLQLGVGCKRRDGGAGATLLQGVERQDAINALRRIHGLFDKLLFTGFIPEERKRPYKEGKARLGAFLHRINFKDGERQKERQKRNVSGSGEGEDGQGRLEDAEQRKESGILSGLFKGRGGWRQRTAPPVGNRKPWSSTDTGGESLG
ncbi:pentatricopeptide repeat protein [Zopfia rhizophila CBS 207.26]|uniref:Pentatricopeptide repeat protein n=1 Tax=Zopfia rhizophila CBS 207.26 TaxID=1314779 RepID=A0A6A6EHZ9_9PEZI|nr:pentatricopeptide repeat protein [Zopfia rhizophila CBS 207.26]